MIECKRIAGAGTLATLLMSTTALADVTPREVWNNWHAYLGGFGYDVSASENTSGDTLNVSDLMLSMQLPEEEGKISIDLGEVAFKDQGDGTVLISMPKEMPIHVLSTIEGETTEVTVNVAYTGMSMVASGTVEDITYAYTAAQVAAVLDKIAVDGETLEDIDFSMSLDDLQGLSKMGVADVITLSQNMTASALNYQLSAQDPDSGALKMEAAVADLSFSGGGTLPDMEYSDDPVVLLNSGFAFEGTFNQGPATFIMNGADDSGPFNLDLASQSSELAGKFGPDGFDYSGNARDVAANFMGADVPLPVSVDLNEVSYDFRMPLLKGEGPQDVRLKLTLGGLTVSDMLWAMIDPGAVLPRDPATLSFDIDGKVTLFADLVDEEASEMNEAPGELNSLTLNDLLLELAGARLAGNGAFVFDNTDLATFDGMPRPNGALNLNLKGANALLDSLIAMGILPEDQAMGARMMMGMFAVPAGEDELNSVIEINEEGHVLANGQRIQ